jgi:hypothetical protein
MAVNGPVLKSMTGGGYFIDPYSTISDDNKCHLAFNAHVTEDGLKVNLVFRDSLYFDADTIKVKVNDLASTYSIISNDETSLYFEVPATIQIGDNDPYTATIAVTAKDADVDTFNISIPGADWNEQDLVGGSIQAHFIK